LHRTLCLFLFCQGIYACSGLWSMAHACCIAARYPMLGRHKYRRSEDRVLGGVQAGNADAYCGAAEGMQKLTTARLERKRGPSSELKAIAGAACDMACCCAISDRNTRPARRTAGHLWSR